MNGYDFKTTRTVKSSPWAGQFSKVTPQALMLWAQSTSAAYLKLPKHMRKKPSKKEAEERLEMCFLTKLPMNQNMS